MKKVSFIIAHHRTWKWTAICVSRLKQFGIPVDQEIIVVDNSPGHPSIQAITETSLGDGLKVISGDPEFTSHGMGYDLGFKASTGDYIFTCETDSFPTRCGWFDEYVKASADFDLIGPEIPQSSGAYIHPAGALISRKVVEAALEWQEAHKEWYFCPGAAIELGTSDRPYHVVANEHFLQKKQYDSPQIDLWRKVGAWQEMRCFDDDTFEDYPRRTGIVNLEPVGQPYHNKIGFEAGQWLAYFAAHKGFRIKKAPTAIAWMDGHHGGQAVCSEVFGGFVHVWCGTVSNLDNGIPADVRELKIRQQEGYWLMLPENLRHQIESMM